MGGECGREGGGGGGKRGEGGGGEKKSVTSKDHCPMMQIFIIFSVGVFFWSL